jgi:UDP-N-acetylmuramoyl-tripeptide--D-alanyl-D-alanine ligase
MNAALTNFFQLTEKNKVAILGDMFELGIESSDEHKRLVEFCMNQTEMIFYFIGNDFFNHKNSNTNMNFYETFESFQTNFTKLKTESSFLLIKGSRGMSLERILDII